MRGAVSAASGRQSASRNQVLPALRKAEVVGLAIREASVASAPLWEPPCLWNTSFTPPRVYAHNCNPSCPNIAYMKEKQALRSGRGATAAGREE